MENVLDNTVLSNPNTPIRNHAFRYAIIVSAIAIVVILMSHFTKWNMESWSYRIINWVISIGAVVWMIWDFKNKQNSGYLRLGQGVSLSVLTGLISGFIVAVFFYFFMKYISPEFLENIQDKAMMDMAEQGLSDEQIEQSMSYASYFMSAGFIAIIALIGSVISYLILGLITSAIMKRD